MLSFLPTVYANPQILGGPKDVAFLFAVSLVVVAVTVIFMVTVGKGLGRRSTFLAAFVGGGFVPLFMIALAYLIVASRRMDDGHGGAMSAMMIMVLGLWAAPISFATSVVCALVQRRRVAP